MTKIKLLKITKGTFYHYIYNIKGNKDDKYIDVRKKLTRNWLLGKTIDSDKNYEWRRYGNLFMCLHSDTDRIIWLENIKGLKTQFDIDMELKKKIEKELGIKRRSKTISSIRYI